jgi:hypothetical protein
VAQLGERVWNHFELAAHSQAWLYGVLLLKLPREVLLNPALWTPGIRGIAFGLPVATALKMVWLLGIGRDVV